MQYRTLLLKLEFVITNKSNTNKSNTKNYNHIISCNIVLQL